MDWSERMNAAVDYIEENLAGEPDINKAAERAACSTFHFQRMFFAVIGVTPTAAREPGVKLTAYPRISFHIELKGGTDMDYKIIEKPAFEVIAKSEKIDAEIVHQFVIIPEDWDKFWWGYWEKTDHEIRGECLDKLSGGRTGKVTGARYLAVTTISEGMKSFSYAVGIERPDGPLPEEYEVITIPAATWAVFEAAGQLPKALHNLEDKVFTEWFPSTGYEHDNKPEMEIYLPGDPNAPDYRCQFWEPVIKKNSK